MTYGLTAAEQPINKVFSGDYQFIVPNYQRPYSWEPEQALRLIDDLESALETGESALPYFLGSVVLVKDRNDRDADVIDGQQRLTTLTIIFAVMRHLHLSAEVDHALTGLIEQRGDVLARLKRRPRLDLRERDRDFFRNYVQVDESLDALLALDERSLKTDAQRNIQRNAAALVRRMADWSQEKIQDFAALLTSDTFLVIVQTENLKSAHRIFSVMNSRGLDLSPADIFKSDVIGAVESPRQDDYAKRWEDAEELVGRRSFEELFLHVRMIFAKVRGQKALLEEFRPQVLDKYLPDRAMEFVDDVLVPYTDALRVVDNASYTATANAAAVNEVLERLSRLENNDWKPVALWAVRHLTHDSTRLLEHLTALERLAVSLELRRAYSTPRAMRYGEVLKRLEDGMGAASMAVSETERREAMAALRGAVYGAPYSRLVLRRLNELLASARLSFDHAVLTIEHVLPQSPREESEWRRSFTDEQRDYWVHRLGNLVLLDRRKNSEAQNFDFAEKKRRYFTSRSGVTPFPITITVLQDTEWTPEVVEKKQADYVARLGDAWDLRFAEDGTDLASLQVDPLPLVNDAPPRSSRRPLLAELIDDGLLTAGDTLTWPRPMLSITHEAVLTPSGALRLEDGREFGSPSGAAESLAEGGINGWLAWRIADGRTLDELVAEREGRDPASVAGDDSEVSLRWALVDEITAAIPPGSWTSYQALAEAVGSHQVPIGQRMARHNGPNYWRVLRGDGTISPGFRWGEGSPHDGQPPISVLRDEGVAFSSGQADRSQFLDSEALLSLVDLDDEEVPDRNEYVSIHELAQSLGLDAKGLRTRLRRDDATERWREAAWTGTGWRFSQGVAERIRARYGTGRES